AFPGASGSTLRSAERAWWSTIVLASLGVDASDGRAGACFEKLFAHYASGAAWVVFPDAAPTLARLRERGLRLAVVSNFHGRLPGILDGLGLSSALDAIVWSTDVGAAKPDARIFRVAAVRLGVPVGDVLHVGDEPDTDVAGARRAGAMAAYLDRRGGVPGTV